MARPGGAAGWQWTSTTAVAVQTPAQNAAALTCQAIGSRPAFDQLFANMPEAALQRLYARCRWRRFPSNQCIVSRDTPMTAMSISSCPGWSGSSRFPPEVVQ